MYQSRLVYSRSESLDALSQDLIEHLLSEITLNFSIICIPSTRSRSFYVLLCYPHLTCSMRFDMHQKTDYRLGDLFTLLVSRPKLVSQDPDSDLPLGEFHIPFTRSPNPRSGLDDPSIFHVP